jgi:hypothetical protein
LPDMIAISPFFYPCSTDPTPSSKPIQSPDNMVLYR